jgi:hypothetical protein
MKIINLHEFSIRKEKKSPLFIDDEKTKETSHYDVTY